MPIPQLPPQAQLPPDLAGQLTQLQMQQQLSQALLGQSMKPINPTRSSGRYIVPISPLEGLSQLGSTALNSKSLADATAGTAGIYAQANQRRNSALSDAFLGDRSSQLPPGLQAQQTDPNGVPGFNAIPQQQSAPQTAQQMQRQGSETPQDIYREALQVAPSFGMDAITLLGEGPYKVRLEAALRRQDPTEVSKLLTEQGIDRNSPEGKAAYASKTNPVTALREGAGGVQYGPDGKPFFSIFSPKLGQGQSLDQSGNVQVAPGYMGAQEQTGTLEANLAGKRSGAEASAKAPFELIDVVDPKSGLTYSVPKSSITGGGQSSNPNPVAPAAPGASVVPPQGVSRGMPSKMSPQQTAELEGRGKALQEYGSDLNQRANGARDNSIRLAELQSLNIDGSSGAMAKGKQKFGEYALAMGMSPDWVKQNLANVPDMQAFEKLTLQLASQQAKQLTSRPTGAEFQQFIGANPNLTQTPQGRAKVMKFMQQMNDLTLQEQQQGQAFWQKNHTLDGFQSEFNKAIESDPKSLLNQLRAENVTVKKYNPTQAPKQSLQFSPEEIDAEMKRRGLK